MTVQCLKCGELNRYEESDVRWDYSGYGYDTKYVVCPHCGQINIIKYVIDRNFDVNRDTRFYSRKSKREGE